MKKLNICLLFLLLLVTLNFQPVVTTEVHAADPPWNADARVSMFYDALLPYGNWVHHGKYGWCWYPYNVPVE